ncbi:hypothetical protein CAEBREN_14058 [Caenorhabditis brenneri]|uniref:PAN-3 domain-containing protein n=1 Tax=Caenorhabditis brenneri TaxID=135651 RepID=G0MIX0_CAEBE|nr:hypothetical protein CAEBREN_14058 [Caenorhabditis brenneri]
MVIIHGAPHVFGSSTIEYFADWMACVNHCYSTQRCVVVYQNDGIDGCEVFEIGNIQEIQTLDAYSGKRVAVKMLSNTTCSLTSEGNSMMGRIQTNSTYQNYSITAREDGVWEFKTSPFYICPDNFWLVLRSKGIWCMGVLFKQDPAGITQIQATQACADNYQGILSGFETTEEKLWVVAIAKDLVTGPYPVHGYWVNGVRKDTCKFKNQTGPSCDGIKAFDITDPLIPNYNAYIWGYDSQPDGMTDNKGTSNCIAFRVKSNAGNGMDDRPCDSVAEPEKVFYNGYVCGVFPNEL